MARRVWRTRDIPPRIIDNDGPFDMERGLGPAVCGPKVLASLDRVWRSARGVPTSEPSQTSGGSHRKRKRDPSPPEPVCLLDAPLIRVDRQKLNKEFAVSLMRFTKLAADAVVDNGPVIQKEFMELRRSAWEPYVTARQDAGAAPPVQGNFEDAAFFDFVSYAQHATIAANLHNAEDARAHSTQVGEDLLKYLRRDRPVLLAALDRRPTFAAICSKLECLLEAFVELGFAQEVAIDPDHGGTRVVCTLQAPATLWSQHALSKLPKMAAAAVSNDFELKAIAAYLAEVHITPMRRETTFDGSTVAHSLEFSPSSLAS